MLTDLRCPVELRASELTEDDRETARAYLRLFNLTQARVARVEADLSWRGADGADLGHTRLGIATPDAGPRSAFTAIASAGGLHGVAQVRVLFTRVEFESGTAWTDADSVLKDVPEPPAPDGRELNRLCAAAGPDAVNFPLRTGEIWLCVCGRANPIRKKTCLRCGRERDQVLSAFSMARLLTKAPPGKSARQVDLPLMAEKKAPQPGEKAGAKKRRARSLSHLKRRTVFFLSFALILLLLSWAVRSIAPATFVPAVKVDQP